MLSKRLQAISNYVDKNDKVIDIGCDHGYLGIYLYTNNITKDILLTDIKQSALNMAINNIKKRNLTIQTKLSDGLKDVDTKEKNTVIISGMGTRTIKEILDISKLSNIEKLIIQSNNNLKELREYLISIGYSLIDETTIEEKDLFYVIGLYKKGKENISKNIIHYGIPKKDKIKYYENLIIKDKEISKKIPLKNIKEKYKIYIEIKNLKKLLKECQC